MSPIRLCSERGCGERAVTRGRCPAHAKERAKLVRSPNNSFYAGLPWRMTRRSKLFADPLCEYVLEDGSTCDHVAEHVHHIVPIEDGGPRRDPKNLMSLCHSHHSKIHAQMRIAPPGRAFA